MIISLLNVADALRRVDILQPDTACLDGSPPLIYVDDAPALSGTLIYFQGGGLCVLPTQQLTDQACLQRSKTQLGSSKFQPTEFTAYPPIISNDRNKNQEFFNFKKVFVRYCDGALHQGYRPDAHVVQGTPLYFKGSSNVRAIFKVLKEQGFLDGKVIISGSSAGGIATALWADYASQTAGSPVEAIVDSGTFFPMSGKNGPLMIALYVKLDSFTNQDKSRFPQPCNDQFCYFPDRMFSKIQARTIILNSNYDQWNLKSSLGLSCVDGHSLAKCSAHDRELADQYFNLTQAFFNSTKHSFWTVSCLYHGLLIEQTYSSPNWLPYQGGPEVQQALHIWYSLRRDVKARDERRWPQNSRCSGPKFSRKY